MWSVVFTPASLGTVVVSAVVTALKTPHQERGLMAQRPVHLLHSGSAWDASSTPGLTPVRAGSGGGGGGGMFRAKVPVRFAGADASPALTPTWKSNQWAKPAEARLNGGDSGDRSPDLKEDLGKLLNDEEIRNNEQQLDRDWYDRCDCRALGGSQRPIQHQLMLRHRKIVNSQQSLSRTCNADIDMLASAMGQRTSILCMHASWKLQTAKLLT